jgi:hypothetical protein
MRTSTEPGSWAVYHIAAEGKQDAANALCDQNAWPDLERQCSGRNTLIRGNITNEAEAELLARGTSGDIKPRTNRAKYSPVVAQR